MKCEKLWNVLFRNKKKLNKSYSLWRKRHISHLPVNFAPTSSLWLFTLCWWYPDIGPCRLVLSVLALVWFAVVCLFACLRNPRVTCSGNWVILFQNKQRCSPLSWGCIIKFKRVHNELLQLQVSTRHTPVANLQQKMPRLGLFQYVTNTTLPHIRDNVGIPVMPVPGHRSSRNRLTVRSEAWRRLETIFQIDPPDFARKVISCEYKLRRTMTSSPHGRYKGRHSTFVT